MEENIIEDKKESKKEDLTKKERDLLFIEKDVNDLLNEKCNESFKIKLMEKIKNIKRYQPFLDYDKIEKEISGFKVDTDVFLEEEGDIEIYTYLMERIKAYKERLFFIFNKAEREYNLLENTYNHLFRIWVGKFSRLSSEKRREGEAEFILDFMFIEREKRRMIYNMVKNSLDHMTDMQSLCSRKVSVIQEVHKVIGSMSFENPSETSKNIEKHRNSINDKLKKFKSENKNATGWDAVPSKKDLE